jgi:trehalose 6-phosphate synthase
MVAQFKSPVSHARGFGHDDHLVIVSNRGPIVHHIDDAGHIRSKPAGGGVAVALSRVAALENCTWIAAASTPADNVVAMTRERLPLGEKSSLRLVRIPEGVNNAFYGSFCNPLLWFVQHSISRQLKPATREQALSSWRSGYLPANQVFAEAVVDEIKGFRAPARVMIHDYHLYLAPKLIRQASPDAVIQQFIHIPWPEPAAWFSLPSCLVKEVCAGLLAADTVCFQTERSVDNFLDTCRAYLGGEADVRPREGAIRFAGQVTSVWSNPISVDVAELRNLAMSGRVQELKRQLGGPEGQATIVRVDRLDPAKNILRGFQAFELLLQRNPALRGRVRFLAFLVPSRSGIGEYDDYKRRVFEFVDRVNETYGTPGWLPITILYEQDREKALAALSIYDVLLVNSLADGMNLVSKEGPIVNERDGVLVLSTAAGSHEELGPACIDVDPHDITETAEALKRALAMPRRLRREVAASLQALIERHQLSDWHRHQMQDLAISQALRTQAQVAYA